MEEEAGECTLQKFPDEVLIKILTSPNIKSHTVMNFGQTCQQFNSLVQDSLLWKRRLQNTWPKIYNVLVLYGSEEWFQQYQYVHTLELRIIRELKALSPANYWKDKEFLFDDASPFFAMCMEKGISLFCVHHILAEIYSKCGYAISSDFPSKSLDTLTIQYYTGRILRFLMHTFLMIRWQEMKLKQIEMSPEIVLNFYVNWINNFEYYDQSVEKKMLDELAEEVIKVLPRNHPLHDTSAETRASWMLSPLPDNVWSAQANLAVHAAVRHVLYTNHGMRLAPLPTVDSLNITKTMKTKKGFSIAVGVIYDGVARRCGVKCSIVAFPNHFFVNWRESYEQPSPTHRVDLSTGELVKKRTCPFRDGGGGSSVAGRDYHPQTLLLGVTEVMHRIPDHERNFSTHLKIQSVMEFLHIAEREVDMSYGYKEFLMFLEIQPFAQQLAESAAPNFYNTDPKHRQIMLSLSELTREGKAEEPRPERTVYRNHKTISVSFAVGMVCQHRMYRYTCVITGWDVHCKASPEWQERMGVQQLTCKNTQPFYTVLAADGTSRYVAQENLKLEVGKRLTVIEDIIGKQFSHFTGSYYIPNEDKAREYPDEAKVIAAYRRQPALLMPTLVKYNTRPVPGNMHLYNLC